ncbi:MAG: hypothetical protein MZW92_46295 [Comamonadaceae bacterium]|nr:hypothetical protein [Comamonadaceae bacterium]
MIDRKFNIALVAALGLTLAACAATKEEPVAQPAEPQSRGPGPGPDGSPDGRPDQHDQLRSTAWRSPVGHRRSAAHLRQPVRTGR